MKLLNWNLERGGTAVSVRDAQQHLIDKLGVDIAVLTEVPAAISQPGAGRVLSPIHRAGTRAGECWVGIFGGSVQPAGQDLPLERMAAAAVAEIDDEQFLIYGSVLPWMAAINQAPNLARHGESGADLFARVLRDQTNDIARLRAQHPDHTLIWAGDFNQPLVGPNRGFSGANRELLCAALVELNLTAWNQNLAHARPGYFAIDLICGPTDRTVRGVSRVDPAVDGLTLSDHAGYLLDL